MSDYFLSGRAETGEDLYISPITSDIADANNIDRDESIGYFLYQKRPGSGNSGACILAKLPSEDAVFELAKLLNLS